MAKRTQKAPQRRATLWLIALLLVGGVIAGVFLLMGGSQEGKLTGTIQPDDHTKGNGPIVLVEYSDFQCSACRNYAPVVEEIAREFNEEITVVFRYFPLGGAFAHSEIAARAAEAAGRQNRFWQMHGRIFATQPQWARMDDAGPLFVQFAREFGLDMELFVADLNSDEVGARVERDRQSGIAAGVQGTPSFFLNGELIASPRSYAEFRDLIRAADRAQ